MDENMITLTIGKQKNIALIAHDGKKKELIEWCDKNKEILKGHFLSGTGTTARLIAEKTGPHFAVGDTCYSWSEDSAVYNPDGKEIIARDNEISLLRKEDVSKAYFGCHTDITIPYSELGDITAVCSDGRKLPLIQSGRFVAAGTEKLNEELEG